MKNLFKNKTVLITGGAGAFGQKFITSLKDSGVARVIVLSRDEMKHAALKRLPQFKECMSFLDFRIGDVTRPSDLELVLPSADIVIHSAAMKHLPECEANVMASTTVNVTGTENVVRAFLRSNAKDLVFLSTDKSPSASSVYGAQKYIGEKLVTEAARLAGTGKRAFTLRYSNVIDSTGSVFNLFSGILSAGREATVNGSNTQRGFVTQDAVCSQLTEYLAHAKGGEVFVFRPVVINIAELATTMQSIIGKGSVVVKNTLGTGWEKESGTLVMPEEAALAKSPNWLSSDHSVVLDFLNRHAEAAAAKLGADNSYTLQDCPVLNGEKLKQFLVPVMRAASII